MDHRGNTPLTVAILLGRAHLLESLFAAGASILVKTRLGWTPYQEATSYGCRVMMRKVLIQRLKEMDSHMKARGREIGKALSRGIQDFTLSLSWTFSTSIPLLSKLCPSDEYKITKLGRSVRVDLSLLGLDKYRWKRGRVSLIYNWLHKEGGARCVLVEWDKKTIQTLYQKKFGDSESAEELPTDEEIEHLISMDLTGPITSTPKIVLPPPVRATTAFLGLFGRTNREEVLVDTLHGQRVSYNTSVWQIEGGAFGVNQRIEHLKAGLGDQQTITGSANSNAMEDERESWVDVDEDEFQDAHEILDDDEPTYPDMDLIHSPTHPITPTNPAYRHLDTPSKNQKSEQSSFTSLSSPYIPSLPSPQPPSYENYFSTSTPLSPPLGRDHIYASSTPKKLRGTLWLTPPSTFPIPLTSLYPILDLLDMQSSITSTPAPHITALKEFFHAVSQEGFPVQSDIPIMPVLRANVKFGNCVLEKVDESLFEIPKIGGSGGWKEGSVVGWAEKKLKENKKNPKK